MPTHYNHPSSLALRRDYALNKKTVLFSGMRYGPLINNNQPQGKNSIKNIMGRTQLARSARCAGCAQPVTILVRIRFQNLLGFEPATKLRMVSVAPKPILKRPRWAFEYWLGRTDSNHDKENQNLLSYH